MNKMTNLHSELQDECLELGSVAEVHFVVIVHLDKRVEYLKEMYTSGR